jgi:SNF2 family DNA or RNA helicase
MASFLERDPWSWSAADVGNFFLQRHVHEVVNAEMPGVSLPRPEDLTAKFDEEQVTGAVLLTAVDHDFLRSSLNIKTLGPRAAVMHCIEKLREFSPGYKRRHESTALVPAFAELSEEPVTRLLDLPDPIGYLRELPAAKAFATAQEAGEPMQLDDVPSTPAEEARPEPNVRPNEVLSANKDGKMRRRLDLTVAAPNEVARDTLGRGNTSKPARDSFDLDDIGRLLPARKLPIDDIFFGDAAVGSELGPVIIDHPLFVREDSDYDITEEKNKNFQYINSDIQVGAAGYISSKLQRFMLGREEFATTRHQKDAVVMYPYRKTMQAQRTTAPHYDRRGRILFSGGTRSALVFQQRGVAGTASGKRAYDMATRENEALIESGADNKGYSQELAAGLAGEYDHLLLRYPDNDAKLMSEDDETLVGEEDGSTESGDDQAEEHEEESIENNEVKETVGRAVYAYITGWQEKQLPKLETERAWTMWKKTKGRKLVRDELVRRARARIQELETRLRKVRTDLERDLWESTANLNRICAALQPTVEDIQLEHWKIGVWNRKQEPRRIPRRIRVPKSGITNDHVTNALRQLPSSSALPIPADDRISVEPCPQPTPPTIPTDDEGHRLRTPKRSSTPDVEDSPFVVPDDDIAETPHAAGGANIDDQGPETNNNKSSFVVDLTKDLQSSPVVPAASAPAKSTAKKPKKGRGSERKLTNSAPSTSEADSWNYDDIEAEQNRFQLLTKLVRDMGPVKRDALWKTWQELMHKNFVKSLAVALSSIVSRQETPPPDGTPARNNLPRMQTMRHCARLLLAFHFCRSDICRGHDELPKDLDNSEMPQDADMKAFVARLRGDLEKRQMPLFSSPVPVRYDDPILIDSDDQDIDSDPIKHKSREPARTRKRVKLDPTTVKMQMDARARMEEARKLQSSDPSALQQMGFADHNTYKHGDKVINTLRKQDQDPIYIESTTAQKMKPYQLDGVQFLWRELTGDLKNARGCLLAHTMGLGKTMQSITLLCAVDTASKSDSTNIVHQLPQDLRLSEADRGNRSLRFLIICPPGLIPNWKRELNDWALPGAFGGNIISIDTTAAKSDYIKALERWSKGGGVLLIGYPLFSRLVNRQKRENPEEANNLANSDDDLYNKDVEMVHRILTQEAELVVADEAHSMKNQRTGIAIAASQFRSTARVALSGTPMSNDVDEIYSLVSWVAPGFVGDKKQFSGYFGLPIKEGLYLDSPAHAKRRSTIKLKSLHSRIEPKVHRAGYDVLKDELKPKVEFVLTVGLTEHQRDAYVATVVALLGSEGDLKQTSTTTLFAWFGVLGLLTAHPSCFRQKLLTPKAAAKKSKTVAAAANTAATAAETAATAVETAATAVETFATAAETFAAEAAEIDLPVPGEEDLFTLGFTQPVVNALIEGLTDSIDPALSAKTRLLQQILHLSKEEGDKVLVFSASLQTLNYLEKLFREDNIRSVRIDGSVPTPERTKRLAAFQSDKGGLDAMLISTKAGGQGLNIQSANRVVIFDFGFNPAWEEQAIGRAYRFGQQKPVFVYRFVAGGTYEANIYNTQMFKMSLTNRVVDKKNSTRNAVRNTKKYLYPPKVVNHEDLTTELELNLDPKVLSRIMAAQISRGDDRDPSIDICSVRTMEVLQAEAEDAPLDESELQQVEQNNTFWVGGKMV